MYLKRNRNGYSWYCLVQKDGKGEKLEEAEHKFITFNFARDCEPDPFDLNDYGSYEGELIFRDSTGAERKVFPYIDTYHHSVAFRLLKKENEYVDERPASQAVNEPEKAQNYYQQTLDGKPDEAYWKMKRDEIGEDDLPFM